MALDLLAIAAAVAARFAGVTPPSGQTLAGATHLLPNNIPNTPYVIVTPPSGELGMPEGFPTARIRDTHDFDVYVLLSKASGDQPVDLARTYAWWPVIRGALAGQMKLGISTVMKAVVTEDYDFDVYAYAGTEYHAWHFIARVWTEDTMAMTI